MRFFSLKVISEGDKITEIEPASEDWWQGTNPHGILGYSLVNLRCSYMFFFWNETDAYGFLK